MFPSPFAARACRGRSCGDLRTRRHLRVARSLAGRWSGLAGGVIQRFAAVRNVCLSSLRDRKDGAEAADRIVVHDAMSVDRTFGSASACLDGCGQRPSAVGSVVY